MPRGEGRCSPRVAAATPTVRHDRAVQKEAPPRKLETAKPQVIRGGDPIEKKGPQRVNPEGCGNKVWD